MAVELGHVLVRGEHHHLVDVVGPTVGGGGEGVVGLELEHRPHHHPDRPHPLLGQRELVEQLGIHPGAGLVAGVDLVAERLDDRVEGGPEVGDVRLPEQGQRRRHDPVGGAHLPPVGSGAGRRPEVRSEQLVGAVEQVELHPSDVTAPGSPPRIRSLPLPMRPLRIMYVSGPVEMRSPLFSNEWRVSQNDAEVAHIRRRNYTSVVDLAAGGRAVMEPVAQGTVRALISGTEVARITRDVVAGPPLGDHRSRLHLRPVQPGDAPPLAAHPGQRHHQPDEGGFGSYNRVRFHNQVAVPLSALLLSWHVVARPWEAAAEPRVLVPSR